MDIGIRELKQQLSEYLEKAARGEVIRITDRGEPKAMLMPLPGRSGIARGIAEGWLKPASDGVRSKAPQRFRSTLSSTEVLDEDRGT